MTAIQVYDGDGASVEASPAVRTKCRLLSEELPVLVRAEEHSTTLLHPNDEKLRGELCLGTYALGGAYTMLQHKDVGNINEGIGLAIKGLKVLATKSRSQVVRAGAAVLLRVSAEIAIDLP